MLCASISAISALPAQGMAVSEVLKRAEQLRGAEKAEGGERQWGGIYHKDSSVWGEGSFAAA